MWLIGAVVTKMINVAIDVRNCTLNTANMCTDKLYNTSAIIYDINCKEIQMTWGILW